jgi:hypothetical protein
MAAAGTSAAAIAAAAAIKNFCTRLRSFDKSCPPILRLPTAGSPMARESPGAKGPAEAAMRARISGKIPASQTIIPPASQCASTLN